MHNFPELKFVPSELEGIAKALPGTKTLPDDKFSKEALIQALTSRPKVIHIASHFQFNPGNDVRSFLLLGNGETWSASELKALPEKALEGVAVFAMSACSTARELSSDAGGVVESFASLLLLKGAESVLATLWPVADPTTAAVMAEFYRLKVANPTWTKLRALHEAQTGLLSGRLKVEGAGDVRMEPVGKPPEGLDLPKFTAPKAAPFAHPYYWAPFILAGNWR